MTPTTAPTLARESFRRHARPLAVVINGVSLSAEPKEFSTGSLGWYCGSKLTVILDGVPVWVQVGLNLTAVGSKELPN
jgi:hypothetical protein